MPWQEPDLPTQRTPNPYDIRPIEEPIRSGGLGAADRPLASVNSANADSALPGGGGLGDTLGDIYERLNRLEETVRLLLARG